MSLKPYIGAIGIPVREASQMKLEEVQTLPVCSETSAVVAEKAAITGLAVPDQEPDEEVPRTGSK